MMASAYDHYEKNLLFFINPFEVFQNFFNEILSPSTRKHRALVLSSSVLSSTRSYARVCPCLPAILRTVFEIGTVRCGLVAINDIKYVQYLKLVKEKVNEIPRDLIPHPRIMPGCTIWTCIHFGHL
jgi:hypothetical protein